MQLWKRQGGSVEEGLCVVTQREVRTAYGDSHKSNSGCCKFDKFAVSLSFYPEQWGTLRHSSHNYPEVPDSDWPIGSGQCGYIVISHFIFRLILISPQSLWTTVVPVSQVLSLCIYVYTGGTEEEQRLGKGIRNPGARVAGSEN